MYKDDIIFLVCFVGFGILLLYFVPAIPAVQVLLVAIFGGIPLGLIIFKIRESKETRGEISQYKTKQSTIQESEKLHLVPTEETTYTLEESTEIYNIMKKEYERGKKIEEDMAKRLQK
jgi:hypothetical protein